MKREGFLLLNVLVYIAISTMLILLLFQYSATWLANRTDGLSYNVMLACQVCARDVAQASPKASHWHRLGTDGIVWRTGNENEWIGWYTKNNQLVRATGIYDPAQQVWHKKVVSIIIPRITDFSIDLHKKGNQVSYLSMQLAHETQQVCRVLGLRNGEI